MKRITVILMTALAMFFVGGSYANAEEQACTTETTDWVLESPGDAWVQVDQRTVVDEEAWEQVVVDQEAIPAQHYSLKGNSDIGKDEVPVFPADYWQANAEQEPPGHYNSTSKPDGSDYVEGDSGLHYASHGSEGLRDWFYFQPAVDEVTHVEYHEAVTHEEFVFEKTTCEDKPTPTPTPEPTNPDNPDDVAPNSPDQPVRTLPHTGAEGWLLGLAALLIAGGGIMVLASRRLTRI